MSQIAPFYFSNLQEFLYENINNKNYLFLFRIYLKQVSELPFYDRDDWPIRVRVCLIWESTNPNTGEEYGLDMTLMDEKVNKLTVSDACLTKKNWAKPTA